ncbi:recombination regulator RecX [Brucepastera parasyntrophica]|uniref:regulatory protein RecX n=1 Tax=Brucepastera parasyntrophica TaxID=2880008 RepID=UPI00210E2B3C|nr:regulatory protein RecX [Brucepastera parasyntrophica]ULQ60617.1 recombination regulator RecX [Brucepastera parasyntrophica]
MASAVPAEDSSSANVNSAVIIRNAERTSPDIFKISLTDGSFFFVRDEYLEAIPALWKILNAENSNFSQLSLSPENAENLFICGRIYLAERTALAYLSRSEHSRRQLELKLRKKNYIPDEISPALDYLESRALIDNKRFAEAWIKNRLIHRNEGRQKLYYGLISRGVPREDAEVVLDQYFSPSDEKDGCLRETEKLLRRTSDQLQIKRSLLRKGFSLKTITQCLEHTRTENLN